MFRFLWNSSGSSINQQAITIPTYRQGDDEDRVELQVRTLLYMFRRCNIGGTRQFSKFEVEPPTSLESSKLDYMFNIEGFRKVMEIEDEHHVLIDWSRNKFRSMCILSERPKGLNGSNQLPKFNHQHFSFQVLECDSSDAQYVKTLSESDIYIEHQVGMDIRRRIVKNALEVVRGGSSRRLTKDDRSYIIRYYLNKVAVEVQVDRLYRGTLRVRMAEKKAEKAEPRTPPQQNSPAKLEIAKLSDISPTRKKPNVPGAPGVRKMKSSSALSNNKPVVSPVKQYIDSPLSNAPMVPKLMKRSSNPNLKPRNTGGNVPPPVPDLPPSPTKSVSSVATASSDEITEDTVRELRAQARIAVKNRLDRERHALKLLLKN